MLPGMVRGRKSMAPGRACRRWSTCLVDEEVGQSRPLWLLAGGGRPDEGQHRSPPLAPTALASLRWVVPCPHEGDSGGGILLPQLLARLTDLDDAPWTGWTCTLGSPDKPWRKGQPQDGGARACSTYSWPHQHRRGGADAERGRVEGMAWGGG